MTSKPAMTMRQIREGLGHNVPPEGTPEPIVQPTAYRVCCLPDDDVNHKFFALYVELKRPGQWVVHDGHRSLRADGEWIDEYGTNGLADGCRHDFDTALRLAKEAAPLVTVNGFTVADALRMAASRPDPTA